jgi:hypothetical protein
MPHGRVARLTGHERVGGVRPWFGADRVAVREDLHDAVVVDAGAQLIAVGEHRGEPDDLGEDTPKRLKVSTTTSLWTAS